MHSLRQIIKMNAEQQEFIDRVLKQPHTEINLLETWKIWKAEKDKQNEQPIEVPHLQRGQRTDTEIV
jgi:hypothetical protein